MDGSVFWKDCCSKSIFFPSNLITVWSGSMIGHAPTRNRATGRRYFHTLFSKIISCISPSWKAHCPSPQFKCIYGPWTFQKLSTNQTFYFPAPIVSWFVVANTVVVTQVLFVQHKSKPSWSVGSKILTVPRTAACIQKYSTCNLLFSYCYLILKSRICSFCSTMTATELAAFTIWINCKVFACRQSSFH